MLHTAHSLTEYLFGKGMHVCLLVADPEKLVRRCGRATCISSMALEVALLGVTEPSAHHFCVTRSVSFHFNRAPELLLGYATCSFPVVSRHLTSWALGNSLDIILLEGGCSQQKGPCRRDG